MRRNYQHFYQQITKPFVRSPRLGKLLLWSNTVIVLLMYGAYILLLLWATIFGPGISRLLPLILIPGSGFVILSALRQKLNFPRPYEEWKIEPLIPREGKGESMPSRHVFSATVIAMSVMSVFWWLGTVLLVLAILLAVIRVLGGAHYPADVFAGFLCGLACGSGLLIV